MSVLSICLWWLLANVAVVVCWARFCRWRDRTQAYEDFRREGVRRYGK